MSLLKTRTVFFYVLLAFLAASVSAFSSAFEPVWRGSDKFVFAEWDSWNSRTLISGDMLFPPDLTGFGEGTKKAIAVQSFQEGYYLGDPAQVLREYSGRQNVLKVNTNGLYITLPNFIAGEKYTLVRFVITYEDTFASFAGFRVTGMTDEGVIPNYNNVLISPQPLQSIRQGSWLTEVYEFTMEPSPQWETFYLLFTHYPSYPYLSDAPYIDAFSFDTICIPEPSGLLMLTLGAAVFSRFRR